MFSKTPNNQTHCTCSVGENGRWLEEMTSAGMRRLSMQVNETGCEDLDCWRASYKHWVKSRHWHKLCINSLHRFLLLLQSLKCFSTYFLPRTNKEIHINFILYKYFIVQILRIKWLIAKQHISNNHNKCLIQLCLCHHSICSPVWIRDVFFLPQSLF